MPNTPPAPDREVQVQIEWLCVGRTYWRGDSLACVIIARLLELAGSLSDRVAMDRFVRFHLTPSDVDASPPDIHLTPLDAAIIARLRAHPDSACEAFASGLEFWDLGVRNGFVWLEDNEPLCFQWQLNESDSSALRERSPWGDLYPPLAPGTAQREKLWTFSTARRKGLASRFALAMLAEARRLGVNALVTHVGEANGPALSLVEKAGWKRCGTIVRYEFDLPILRHLNYGVAVHLRQSQRAPATNRAAGVVAGARQLLRAFDRIIVSRSPRQPTAGV